MNNRVDYLLSTIAYVHFTGSVYFNPPTHYQAQCSLDMELWPYDSQNCSVSMGSWSHDGSTLNIKLANNSSSFTIYPERVGATFIM